MILAEFASIYSLWAVKQSVCSTCLDLRSLFLLNQLRFLFLVAISTYIFCTHTVLLNSSRYDLIALSIDSLYPKQRANQVLFILLYYFVFVFMGETILIVRMGQGVYTFNLKVFMLN